MAEFQKIASFEDAQSFREYVEYLGVSLPCDDEILRAPASPLAAPIRIGERTVGNRWCVQPMEGWDGTVAGEPSDLTRRRWQRFGISGAKLIWGGEAVAVLPEGRANPNQLVINERTVGALAELREGLVRAHTERFGRTDDLLIGLQLTHSGRFCRPERKDRLEPRIAYRHPLLDGRFGIADDGSVLSDAEVERIIGAYGRAAARAQSAGFDFVDLKQCHGYLGHEFLSAVTRPGPYGGSLENRTRFLRECIAAVRAHAPDLTLGVRLSAFDFVPFRPDPDRSRPGRLGPGIPEEFHDCLPYRAAFGANAAEPVRPDLAETMQVVAMLEGLGVRLLNVTAGSPYYNPHIQRPAIYPPSDGYQPPEDPLSGVARQVAATAAIKRAFPRMVVVGSAYSYLQEFLPHVAQAVVRSGGADFVGIGRMTLSYPELPADILERGELDHRRICRTFSDCTTAPRNGLVSGCYPLDPFYKDSPLRLELQAIKRGKREA
jgi:2,4-dienoyl-CoA reductase-like NADH-dependent reductase (Old Yellow Enzyme family)